MVINGFDKVTLLNYPGKVACTIFTKGCNFKCEFCHNSGLIDNSNIGIINEIEIFKYLEKRKNILDGVCISGGEPLIQKDIKIFIKRIKDMGYKVKLDTNGSNPKLLSELINDNLIDYVAMDIKNVFDKYKTIAGDNVNIDNIKESIKVIEESNIEYEFRTTLVHEYHTINDIREILKLINKKSPYYLQNFVNSDGVVNKKLTSFTNDELIYIRESLKEFPNVIFRDI